MGWLGRLFGEKDAGDAGWSGGDMDVRQAISDKMAAIMGEPPPDEMLASMVVDFEATRRPPGMEENPLEASPQLVRLFVLYKIVHTISREVMRMTGKSLGDGDFRSLCEKVVNELPPTPTKREIVVAIKTNLQRMA